MGLKSLGKIIQAFDTRLNLFAWLILNYFLLWDILQCRRLETWKNTYKQLPEKAFGSISEMEMLLGFSTFKFNRSDLIFPEIEKNKFWIEGKSVGHPLMHSKNRVDNDILFSSTAQFSVITGANMAGKSTYLRTVGVNLVLALCGGPVCAKYFKTSILKPFTSIKTSDSLSNNESYFYAELLRLQRIIKALNTGDSYFIILDEILKGTNSKDKEQGSKALVQKLISLNATGIIATHDLQLAELKTNFPQNIENECFEVEIENDKLVFDYKLRRGISKNLNATFLMKTMGIS
jgi:DNA mismatch repair ATPase MutS